MKKTLKIPVQLHCHFTSGMADMAYMKAIEAGCDVVDTAISSLSLGSSQPATESIVAAFKGTPFDTELDIELIGQVGEYFKKIRSNYDIPLEVIMGVDTDVLNYQIPGGMISNLTSQLAGQNASHRLGEVLKEVPRVRAELGYPPLVTPSSQIVGTQAVMNVITGERYKIVLTEVKNYLKGLYGKPPGELDPDLVKKVLNDEEPFQGRPADLLEPQLEKTREEMKNEIQKEEDLLSYIIFPQVAMSFFKNRSSHQELPAKKEGVSAQAPVKNNSSENQGTREIQLTELYTVDETLVFSDGNGSFAYPAA